MVRFPLVWRRLAALVFRRLSPSSRLRRALVRRSIVSGWAAFHRQDWELILVRVAPDVVYEFNPGLQTVGLVGTFRGHEGMLEAMGKFTEIWDFELEPAYIIDLGDRLLSLGFNRSRALASGVRLEEEWAQLATVPEGLVTHQQAFFSWDEGLRAAGLDPNAIALPDREKAGEPASRATA